MLSVARPIVTGPPSRVSWRCLPSGPTSRKDGMGDVGRGNLVDQRSGEVDRRRGGRRIGQRRIGRPDRRHRPRFGWRSPRRGRLSVCL